MSASSTAVGGRTTQEEAGGSIRRLRTARSPRCSALNASTHGQTQGNANAGQDAWKPQENPRSSPQTCSPLRNLPDRGQGVGGPTMQNLAGSSASNHGTPVERLATAGRSHDDKPFFDSGHGGTDERQRGCKQPAGGALGGSQPSGVPNDLGGRVREAVSPPSV